MFNGDTNTTVYYLPWTTGWSSSYGGCTAVPWNGPPPFTYVTQGTNVTITGYIGQGGAVIIPGTINGLTVTGIAANAFYDNSNLTSVTIPDSITNVGDNAFYDCASLTNITIGSGVTNLGNSAFDSCTNLAGVYFQGNAPDLGTSVFDGDSNATVYYLPGTATWSATYGGRPVVLLYYNYSIDGTNVTITGYTGPGGAVVIPGTITGLPVTGIGDSAFYLNTNFTSVTMGTNVTSIGYCALR